MRVLVGALNWTSQVGFAPIPVQEGSGSPVRFEFYWKKA